MHLIDTKVICGLRKGGCANPGVTAFVAGLAPDDIYLSVQTIGEIRRGLESTRHRGDHEQADRLEVWLEALLTDYSDRILGFDLDCAQVWGGSCHSIPSTPSTSRSPPLPCFGETAFEVIEQAP